MPFEPFICPLISKTVLIYPWVAQSPEDVAMVMKGTVDVEVCLTGEPDVVNAGQFRTIQCHLILVLVEVLSPKLLI